MHIPLPVEYIAKGRLEVWKEGPRQRDRRQEAKQTQVTNLKVERRMQKEERQLTNERNSLTTYISDSIYHHFYNIVYHLMTECIIHY